MVDHAAETAVAGRHLARNQPCPTSRPTSVKSQRSRLTVTTSLCSAAVNTTLLAFAAGHSAVDMDRKSAAPAPDAPYSNRSTSPARAAHGSKPAPHAVAAGQDGDRQTGRLTDTVSLRRPCRVLCEQCQYDDNNDDMYQLSRMNPRDGIVL